MGAKDRETVILRAPRAGLVGSLFATVFIGMITLFLLGAAVFVLAGSELSLGLFLLAMTGLMWVLFHYVLRDTRGKMGWKITLMPDGLHLDLPRGRSLIHRARPVHTQFAYDDIEAIETRFEAYRSFGMANMHRSYALKLRSGEVIILGEDRALGTNMATAYLGEAVGQLVQYGNLDVRDLGMAEGKGGILSVINTKPPKWDAPDLPLESQAKLWQRVGLTGLIAGTAFAVVLAAMILRSVFA